MTTSRYRNITKALIDEMGISVALLKGSSRAQEIVYARMIFAHILKNRELKTETEIAEFLKKDRSVIYYYISQLETELKFNKRLKQTYDNVVSKITTKEKTLKIEDRIFIESCKNFGVTVLREYKFYPNRKWRFDFAIPELKIAIEKEGGIWIGGRHNRPSGFIGDMEKYNSAGSIGWIVLRTTPKTMNSEEFLNLVHETIKMRQN